MRTSSQENARNWAGCLSARLTVTSSVGAGVLSRCANLFHPLAILVLCSLINRCKLK